MMENLREAAQSAPLSIKQNGTASACACIPPNSFTFKVKEMDLEMFTNKGNQEGYSLCFIK